MSLIRIIDEVLARQKRLRSALALELAEAQEELHNSTEQSPLASNILARFEAASILFDEPVVTHSAVETLAIEREHFRIRASDNKRAAAAMRRRRRGKDA